MIKLQNTKLCCLAQLLPDVTWWPLGTSNHWRWSRAWVLPPHPPGHRQGPRQSGDTPHPRLHPLMPRPTSSTLIGHPCRLHPRAPPQIPPRRSHPPQALSKPRRRRPPCGPAPRRGKKVPHLWNVVWSGDAPYSLPSEAVSSTHTQVCTWPQVPAHSAQAGTFGPGVTARPSTCRPSTGRARPLPRGQAGCPGALAGFWKLPAGSSGKGCSSLENRAAEEACTGFINCI